MPLYEYECETCGKRFEVIQKFSDGPVEVCKHCGKGPVQRLLSSPAIQFKGSGWYITDYGQKGKSDSSKRAAEGKSESTKPETTTESTSESKSESKGDSASGSSSSTSNPPATPSKS